MKTIRVTGKGEIRLHPDTARITIDLEGHYKEYTDTLRRSAEDTEALKDLLQPFGFERSDLKTLSFNIDAEYESFREKGEWKQRFKGYQFLHSVRLQFPSDNERLGRILYALANSRLSPEFRISYTVADPEAARNELLGKAVADSKAKAAVLTEAGGVRLGEIQTIDYSWGRLDIEYRPMRSNMLCDCEAPMATKASYDIDIEPDDIELSDTVTVVWEIL